MTGVLIQGGCGDRHARGEQPVKAKRTLQGPDCPLEPPAGCGPGNPSGSDFSLQRRETITAALETAPFTVFNDGRASSPTQGPSSLRLLSSGGCRQSSASRLCL